MNRHQRRAAKSDREQLRKGIGALEQTGGGLLDLVLLRGDTLLDVTFASMWGDPLATALLVSFSDIFEKIEGAPADKPMLCGSCPAGLRDGAYTIAVVHPERGTQPHGMGLAICEACGTTDDQIRSKAIEALRTIWPNVRAITITHRNGGRA